MEGTSDRIKCHWSLRVEAFSSTRMREYDLPIFPYRDNDTSRNLGSLRGRVVNRLLDAGRSRLG